jgi:hypothetical protein
MVIQVIPLFAKVNTSAWTYFHEHQSEISAITGEHIIVAIPQTVLKGDHRDIYSAAGSKRYAGLKLADLPCLWIEGTGAKLTIPIPSGEEQINKVLAVLTDAAKSSISWSEFKEKAEKQMNEQLPEKSIGSLNPIVVLKDAIQAVPAMRYALGVLGLVAVVAIVAAWGIEFKGAVFGAVIMLILMVAVLVFAKLTQIGSKHFLRPALFFMWAFVLLTIATGTSIFTAAAFGVPKGIHELIFGNVRDKVTNTPTFPAIVTVNPLPAVSIKIGQPDDRIRATFNGVRLHEGGATSISIKPTDLKDGDNYLDIDLFNNATRTGGTGLLGGAQKEGWSYSFKLEVGDNQFPYKDSHGNDPPDSQWGQWFSVRKIVLNVQRDTGIITVREK